MKTFFFLIFIIVFILIHIGIIPPIEIKISKNELSRLIKIKEPRYISVEATAYAPPLFPRGQPTCTGNPVGWGTVAVDPSVILLGTKLRILKRGQNGKISYLFKRKVFIADDIGRLIKKKKIDIWMPTLTQAEEWGRRPGKHYPEKEILVEIVSSP